MYNIGSIISIQYAFVEDISTISDPDENGEVEITFKAGKSFTDLSFTQESATMNESQENSDAGNYYSQSLTCRVPKISEPGTVIMQGLRNKDIILEIKDANAVKVIMGLLNSPARMSYKYLRPAGAAGYNGYELSFQANCIDPAPFLAV